MRTRPDLLESANNLIGRRVGGWCDLAPGADHTLITKREIARLSVFSGNAFIEVKAGGSKDVIGFILLAAGAIEVSPLFELAGFVRDPGEAAAFDAAEVNIEKPVARRRNHRAATDVADDLQRSCVAAGLQVLEAAGSHCSDCGGNILALGLFQVLYLYADRGEAARHGAVVAKALIDARAAIEPAAHCHEFIGGGLCAFLA